MRKCVVIDVVGLSASLVGERTPFLRDLARQGGMAAVRPLLPAVTCPVQATYLTGFPPSRHGIVANGWYEREEAEVRFWRQSNRLVEAPKVWERARRLDPSFTCANLFWWFNMYSTVDVSVTPRPIYAADGRKFPDIYTEPPELRHSLQRELGTFPLFRFWGPGASIEASRWIAAAAERVEREHDPTLTLIYLPHLDYDLQRLGPDDPAIDRALAEVDEICRGLVRFYRGRGARVLLLSEYGIGAVEGAVAINRLLRERGWLRVREERGGELLDPGASRAFAVADHQVAHLYLRDPGERATLRRLIESIDGVGAILDREEQAAAGIAHPRGGDLLAVARPERWFSYYYWLSDAKAPDFARTVEIHRKPGYDPAELFLDPRRRAVRLGIAWRLLRRRLGLRTLMDLIPLDAGLVKGSHGHLPKERELWPLVISGERGWLPGSIIEPTAIHDLILDHLFADTVRPAEYR